jgi:SAM-dependent methyltransferase
MNSAERVSHVDPSDNFVFARSRLAYTEAAKMVGGVTLEIGTGSGYGVEVLSHSVVSLTTIDKHEPHGGLGSYPNVDFHRMKVPPLGFPSSSFDCVVSFQVIEHIKDDFTFLSEVNRVLRHGGKFIVTTPNSRMSLSRNPWHVREYSPGEFTNLMECHFDRVEALGVFGNGKVMDYYERNRQGVESITRFDPLDLQHRLPRWMLRMPYDVANRLNRRRLLEQNEELTGSIAPGDYRLGPVADDAFDLFYIGTKL